MSSSNVGYKNGNVVFSKNQVSPLNQPVNKPKNISLKK